MEPKLLFWTLVWLQFLCPLRSPAGSTQPRPQQWLKTEVVQSHIIRFVCLTEYSLWYCQRKTFTTTFIPFQFKWFMTHAYKASRWVNKSFFVWQSKSPSQGPQPNQKTFSQLVFEDVALLFFFAVDFILFRIYLLNSLREQSAFCCTIQRKPHKLLMSSIDPYTMTKVHCVSYGSSILIHINGEISVTYS